MTLMVCVDENWGIGRAGDLLLRIPEDMKFFREKTTGNVVVMGRKTLDSLPKGKALPNRANVVITRDPDFVRADVMVCHSPEEAAKQAKALGKDVFVIGGGSVYEQMLPYCERAYVTKLNTAFPADTFFPNLDVDSEWEMVSVGEKKCYEDISYCVVEYRRK